MSKGRVWGWIGFGAGVLALAALVAWQGLSEVGAAFGQAGWGLALLVVVFLPHLALCAASWRLLFARGEEPRFADALRAMWIGMSVNTLVPSATIGGEVVKARLLTLWGHAAAAAGASVVADKTVQASTVVIWALIGAMLLVALASGDGFLFAALGGTVVFALAVAGFVAVQSAGAFGFLARLAARFGDARRSGRLVRMATRLDAAIREVYRRPGRLLWSCALRLAARVVLAGEVWLAAWLMGYPISFAEAVALRSIGVAVRSAAFLVPNGLGVQEGAFIAVGSLLGLDAEVMLAVSLATRARELVVGIPGVLAWQHAEGRALWRRRAAGQAAE